VVLLLIPAIQVLLRVVSGGLFHGRSMVEMCLMLLPLVTYLGLGVFCGFAAVWCVPGWPWARRNYG
jgi:hypothetical protein